MADSNSSTGVVAIFAIVLLALIAGFLAYRAGVFGGSGGNSHKLDVNVTTPK